MAVRIQIPMHLRPHSEGSAAVQAAGATVRDALDDLVRRYPGIGERIFENNQVRRFINIYLNDEDIRYLDNLATPVKDGDELSIIPAVAGGPGSNIDIEGSLHRDADVNICVLDANPSKENLEALQAQVVRFMEAAGFTLGYQEEPRSGSWFRRFLFHSSKPLTPEEARQRYQHSKEALQEVAADEMQKNDISLITAAQGLIDSVRSFDSVIIRLGNIILIKHGNSQTSHLVIEQIPQRLARELDFQSDLLKDPGALIAFLQSRIGTISSHALQQTVSFGSRGREGEDGTVFQKSPALMRAGSSECPMQADCAIVTALSEELKAVLFHFRSYRTVASDKSPAVFYETASGNGLKVVAATTTAIGQLAASALAHDVLDLYHPKTLLLVGIAGGLDRNIPLGDIVASEQIVDYELGKVTTEGFGPRWSVYRADAALLSRVRSWTNQNWQQYVRAKRPTGKATPGLHIGVYLSGNKVIADEQTAGALKSVWRKAAAIEMEAAGIIAMLHHRKDPPGFIVFKGICDYADSKKADNWQAYAADVAASCAFSFVLEHLQRSDVARTRRERPDLPACGELLDALSAAYDLTELKTLSFVLGVDWDEIPGSRKSEKIVEFVGYLNRRNRLQDLVQRVNQERDNLLRAHSGRDA